MVKYIFLDTNNWIYLSNGYNVYSGKHEELHFKIFDTLKKRSEQGSLRFLINDIIIDEWNRNEGQRSEQLKALQNKVTSYRSSLKAMTGFIDEQNIEISSLDKQLEESYQRKIDKHKEHIKNVEDFILNQTTKIDITDSSKLEAIELALKKKAPFIGDKKNSVADAVILLSSIEHIEMIAQSVTSFWDDDDIFEPIKIYPDSYFVSSNGGDFSSKENKEIIHPDLEPILEKTNTKFFYNLSKLINFLEEEFLTQEEEEALETISTGKFCEVCEYEHFGTVHTSGYHDVYDPRIVRYDPNQLKIDFDEYKYPANEEEAYSTLRTAKCEMCDAKFIECSCGELIHFEEKNYVVECTNGCGTKYRIHADVDKKGTIHNIDYEILEEYTCATCGGEFSTIDESGNCEECADYELKYLND